MFGKVSRAKDYACIEVEGSRDLLNMQFLNEVFYYEGKTKSKPTWPCVKKRLPPKPNN